LWFDNRGSNFISWSSDDESKSGAFYIALDREPEPLSSTIIGKAIEEEQIDGFELVYSDNIIRIYKLRE